MEDHVALRKLPDRALVRELLDYNPRTGTLRWKSRARTHFDTMNRCIWWNGRYAGKLAGCLGGGGYLVVRIRPGNYLAHRLVWLLVHGEPVPDIIDHIDYNKTNNAARNLRAASHGQNLANGPRRRNNTSGVKGVRIQDGGFVVSITHNGKRYHIGKFATLAEAAAARWAVAKLLQGEFAHR
jgi:hypothetical protein